VKIDFGITLLYTIMCFFFIQDGVIDKMVVLNWLIIMIGPSAES